MTVSPDGKHVYVAGAGDSAVTVFGRDSTTGALTFVEVQRDGVGGVDGLDAASSVKVSPDGKHLYAAGWTDDAVAVFGRDSTTGALTFIEVQLDGVGGVDGLDAANSVAVSLDGQHVYAVGGRDRAVSVFGRDSTTGALTFVEVQRDGVGGVDGLAGASSVTISPDGKHVYAAGSDDDAVAVFGRDSTTGELTFIEVQRDGVGVVDGLDAAFSVTVSRDGKHLYAAGAVDDAVAVFGRDSTTGGLTFIEVQRDGVGVVDGLDAAFSVTVSPDGYHVYAASLKDDAVATFQVTPTCNSTVDLSFVDGVTTWTFVVEATQPSTWSVSAIIFGNDIPLWSIDLPPIPSITITISFPLPPIGVIEIQSTLAVGVVECTASDSVDSGP